MSYNFSNFDLLILNNSMMKFLYLIILTFIPTLISAQQTDLPKYLTEYEKEIWDEYLIDLQSTARTANLPEVPVRVMGEWEEIQALFITWRSYPAILTEIVRHAVEEVTVYIITTNEASVTNTLNNAGVSLENVEFVNWPSNSVWIRDYGPWAVYENDVEQLAISDYIYNRPRPSDNMVPLRVAELFDVPYYAAIDAPYDWVHTGGNNLVDGYKTGYSSKITLVENPSKTEEEIDHIAGRLFGYEQYIKFEELPFDAISHLDMHMRFIDEETVIVGEYPEGVADGPQINENIEYLLNNHQTSFGNSFNIIRIPMPPAADGRYPDQGGHYRTFTNSIFLNRTILVPIYEEQYDTVGLRIYREALPGYNVVGIDCNAMIGSFGALHCITKTVGIEDPLWIAHPRVRDIWSDQHESEVTAKVKHREGIEEVVLFYRSSADSVYSEISMTAEPEREDWFAAQLPAFAYGSEVHYYIEARANDGKVQRRPIVAPEGYFQFNVHQSVSPPEVAFSSNRTSICPGESVRFLDRTVGGVTELQWIFEGGIPEESNLPNPEVIYTEPGIYPVRLIATNSVGQEEIVVEHYITVEGGIRPFVEDFSQGIQMEVWGNNSSSSQGFLWEDFENSNCFNNNAIRVDNFTNDNRGIVTSLGVTFDLTEFVQPRLYFSHAYAPYDDSFFDRLQIIINECGLETEVIFDQSGSNLATAAETGDNVFIPQDCSEWSNNSIDIFSYGGKVIQLEFNNIGGWGNMLYLDNIFIKDMANENIPPQAAFIQPSKDTTITSDFPLSLEIITSAFDSDGFITLVEVNAGELGEFSFDSEPYIFTIEIDTSGIYPLTIVATDNDGENSGDTQIELIVDDLGVSVIDMSEDRPFEIFPNPGKNIIYLKGNLPQGCSQSKIWIKNVNGVTVKHIHDLDQVKNGLIVDHLPPAVYFMNIEVCGDQYQLPFIIIE
ncbi:MAG: PKD domain-containing protein [Saprospirales bacterium]|nr:MAG: PKD domain-containing protein [Saprospirales bacterium]